MKNLITIFIVCSVWALPLMVKAQINEEKMDKDLRVASQVLTTLTHGDEGRMMLYGGDNVEGNYVEGYGVIFSVSGRSSFYVSTGARAYNYRTQRGAVVVSPKPPKAPKVDYTGKENEKQKQMQIEQEQAEEIDFESTIVEFLADYSQLIGQLKPTDKIVVSTKKSEYVFVMTDEDESINAAGGSGVSAELLKKDHNDYITGKISHDQLVAKIKVTKNDAEGSRAMDLDLFGSMLNTIYNESYTETYFMNWRPEYERIKGVGAIYAFKVFSSYEEDGGYRMPGINKEDLTDEDRNEHVEKLYPLFVSGMKENIIQYGRTIKSLESDEMLLLKITLTKCDGCSIPKKIQFAVKRSVLSDFNAGKTSLKDATAKVKVSEL